MKSEDKCKRAYNYQNMTVLLKCFPHSTNDVRGVVYKLCLIFRGTELKNCGANF